jgi:hypothetical protein
MFSAPMHTIMKNNEHPEKPIMCINIFIPKPFMTQFLGFFLLNVLTFTHWTFVYLVHAQGNDPN